MLNEKNPQRMTETIKEIVYYKPPHKHTITVKNEKVSFKDYFSVIKSSLGNRAMGIRITAEIESVNSSDEKVDTLPLNTTALIINNDYLKRCIDELRTFENRNYYISDKDMDEIEELYHFIDECEKPILYPQYTYEFLVPNYNYKDEYNVFDRTYLEDFLVLVKDVEMIVNTLREGVLNV